VFGDELCFVAHGYDNVWQAAAAHSAVIWYGTRCWNASTCKLCGLFM